MSYFRERKKRERKRPKERKEKRREESTLFCGTGLDIIGTTYILTEYTYLTYVSDEDDSDSYALEFECSDWFSERHSEHGPSITTQTDHKLSLVIAIVPH